MLEPAEIAAGAACAAALAGWVAAINASRTLARQRRDSRERSRPMVAAELRDQPYASATQALVIRNLGPTIARNVRITFDPEIPDPVDPKQSVTPFLKRRYAAPIPVLTPGMELDNIWFSGEPSSSGWSNTEPMPDTCTVRIAYDAPDGTRYDDEFPIDVGVIRDRTYVTSSGDPVEIAKGILKTLKGIESKL
jgi:hypothetical protein